jgi:hypothetical protein
MDRHRDGHRAGGLDRSGVEGIENGSSISPSTPLTRPSCCSDPDIPHPTGEQDSKITADFGPLSSPPAGMQNAKRTTCPSCILHSAFCIEGGES